MPTYDYKCDKCEHEFEAFQSITADALEKCPECGTNSLRRLIGAGAGLIFKGSGFYITDYKGGRPSSGGGADSGSDASSARSESSSPTESSSSKADKSE
jgi:putative FmdB family regulatory protein